MISKLKASPSLGSFSVVKLTAGNRVKHAINIHAFSTDTSYEGTASARIQTGDVLFIMFSYREPLILRPQHDEAYKLIDVVFVASVKYGAFLEVPYIDTVCVLT